MGADTAGGRRARRADLRTCLRAPGGWGRGSMPVAQRHGTREPRGVRFLRSLPSLACLAPPAAPQSRSRHRARAARQRLPAACLAAPGPRRNTY